MTPGLRLLLAALLSTAPIAEPEAQELQEYSAVYRASAFGLSASAERRLSRLDAGNYRLENHVHAELAGQTIASLEQVSELTMVDAGVQPHRRKVWLSAPDTPEARAKVLEKLEEIAASFKGVENAYAIQAGREIRVIVSAEDVDDESAMKVARDIANKVENEMTYPGEIQVTLLREVRCIEYAK